MTKQRRVLIVSHWFPPFHAVASVRMGKLAKHMVDQGWDVRVIAGDATAGATLQMEIPADRVSYTAWVKSDRYIQDLLGSFLPSKAKPAATTAPSTAEQAPEQPQSKQSPSFLRATAKRLMHEMVGWPDNRASWSKTAIAAGENLLKTWRPDVIFATSPPMTSLIAAEKLARRAGIPWVAEFRDMWTDNPYYEYSLPRLLIERAWEQRVLSRASAIVTVSPTWQPKLQKKYGRPTIVAMNGYDVADFPEAIPAQPETTGPLKIVYTGHIYHGHRDPSLLFEALRAIKATPADVTVEFVGTQISELKALAATFGLQDLVRVQDRIPYRDALRIQLHADVTLHMQWCDPKEEGTIAAKVFDYLGARRPILGIALEDSVVAKLVHARGAGLVTNDATKIATQLRQWIAQKKQGGIDALPAAASEGLERVHQLAKIEALLKSVADGKA